MRHFPLTLALCSVFLFSSCLLDDVLEADLSSSDLSAEQVIAGLREALSVGIDTASSNLGQVNGYLMNEAVRIILPPDVSEALSVVSSLKQQVQSIPFASNILDFAFLDLRDSLRVTMNRAAEEAAPASKEIFKNAIISMIISDGFEILNGADTAATHYLRGRTYSNLSDAYSPIVETRLSRVGATEVWSKIASGYNTLAALKRSSSLTSGLIDLPRDSLTTDLARYTTEHALNGLFHVVGEEEQRIRTDPIARVTEILETVFGSRD